MHIGLSFTRIYVWNKASKVLSWSCGLACGVYQGRTLWLRLWHSTESSCKVNKGVIHLFICAYSSPPCCYVPLASSSWLNLILYQLWGFQLLSWSPNCLVYQIPVSDTRPSLKKTKQTLKGKRVPTLRGTDTLWARSASQHVLTVSHSSPTSLLCCTVPQRTCDNVDSDRPQQRSRSTDVLGTLHSNSSLLF